MKIFLTLWVTINSIAFIFYGSVLLVSKEPIIIVLLFGVISVGYGVLAFIRAISILVSVNPIKPVFVNVLGLIYFGLFVFGALDGGSFSGHEILGLVIAASFLAANWFALNKLARMRMPPNKSLSADTLTRAR